MSSPLTPHEQRIVRKALMDYQEDIEQRDDLPDEARELLDADLASIEAKLLDD